MFVWKNITEIDRKLIEEFDSGNPEFNDFLKEKASDWQTNSEAATYCFVLEEEAKEQNIQHIHGYVSINALGLKYNSDDASQYLSCAEIRMFAISNSLRKRHDPTISYSNMIFKTVLQNLYEMSTHTIGFRAIFLNANHDGYELYRNNGFLEITDYIAPNKDEKLEIDNCKPMLLIISDDMLYNIFS